MSDQRMDVYLEQGKKIAFAGALEWPGWCRKGRNEESALQALLDYAPRYASILAESGLGFSIPAENSALRVTERLEGTSTTDFGAPDAAPTFDSAPMDDEGLARCRAILEACWNALDKAVTQAQGKELQKGPRGGGRDLEGVVWHVINAERGYLNRLGVKLEKREGESLSEALARTRPALLEALEASAAGELPRVGPRGGKIWPARYFVRRVAWHVLDHVWEIEDRVL